MKGALLLLPAATTLSACGGMNRAVAVLPNTLDDLSDKTAPLRADRDEPGEDEEAPVR